jgi:hypothetical protein
MIEKTNEDLSKEEKNLLKVYMGGTNEIISDLFVNNTCFLDEESLGNALK